MNIIKNSFSIFLLVLLINLLSLGISAQTIEEILIKGDWREVSILEEDSSVVVLDEALIQSQPIKHFENLSYLVPNLNFAASDSRARYFQIRGIGERSGYERTPNSAVGFLIDDIDYSGQGGIATTFDVDQIEIYRGPQGSRIGSNALAGLIYIKTKDPSDKFEGTSEITLGTYGNLNRGIAFGGPSKFNEKITYRLALRKDYSDGFRKNLYLDKSDTSKKDESTFRLKTNWKANDKTLVKTLITKIDMDDPADIWTIDGSLNTLSDRPGMDSQKTDAYGLKIFHQFRRLELQSLTSSTDTNVELSYDADWGNSISHAPYIYDYFSETMRNRDTFSQEFRLVSDFEESRSAKSTEWVIGLSYFDTKESNLKNDDGIYGDPLDPYGPYPSRSSSSNIFSSNSISVFGNFDYLLDINTKFSIGLRWENYESSYSDSFGEKFNPSNKMLGGKLSFNKNLTEDSYLFISAARGFNQGGFNLNLGLDPDSQNDSLYYDPEFLTNYEIGLNSKLLESKMNFAAVFFYSYRDDQQVLISTQVDPTDPNTFLFLTQNAAEGVNKGLEINMDYKLNQSFNIYANLGFLKTQIKNWQSRPDLEGREQAHAPEKSYAVGLNFSPSPNTNLSLNIVGKSNFYYSDSHNNKSKSYSLTNLNYEYYMGQWTYTAWVRNVFDEYYSVRGFFFGNEAPNFEDTLYERHGDPRHAGFSVRYDF